MSLITEPESSGLVRTFISRYRVMRTPVPVKEPKHNSSLARIEMVTAHRRMPRWAAAQIAWRQAWNAKDCGC